MSFRHALLAGLAAVASGLTPAAARAPDAPPPPRVVSGPLCGGEDGDCEAFPLHLRSTATAPLALHARPSDTAPVVGRVLPGETADIVARQTTYLPHRGVVSAGGGGLSPGDVVYLFYGPDVARPGAPPRPAVTDADGDQNLFALWRRGQKLWVRLNVEGAPDIAWEGEPTDTRRHRIYWVRLDRATGPGGWLRAPEDSFCWVGADC